MSEPMVRILILGTGDWAAAHVANYAKIAGCRVVAGVDADAARAESFCAAHGIPRAFDSLDAAIAWGEFDAVSNVTPDPTHHPTTMKLIAAGKHMFCEKPLAPRHDLALEMTQAVEAAGLVGMVNLNYRNVPGLQEARRMIEAGAVGEVRHVEASYRQSWLVGNHWGEWHSNARWLWRLSSEHGSKGVLGDIGIHILDFATYATGLEPVSLQARLKTFPKAPGDQIGAYRLDANDSAVMSLELENGALGIIHASRYMTGYGNALRLHVFGDAGALELEYSHETTLLRVCDGAKVHDLAWRGIICPSVKTNWEHFVEAARARKGREPSFRRATALQKVLDACFEPESQAALALPGSA